MCMYVMYAYYILFDTLCSLNGSMDFNFKRAIRFFLIVKVTLKTLKLKKIKITVFEAKLYLKFFFQTYQGGY